MEVELKYHPDKDFVSFLISGFREGFDIRYTGPERSRVSRILLSAQNNTEKVKQYLDQEINEGRILGPFPQPPLENMQCQPIGIVPKMTEGKFRTIMDLSYPIGDSINDFIDKQEFSLRYITVDKVI